MSDTASHTATGETGEEWALKFASTHNGRVALVTGAARGIGLGIAAWLIAEGWQVVLTDLDRARGSKVASV
ncbi:oxidoreductase, partial [Pseudomonas syringae pv. actinidiae ICMP 19096]